MGIRKANSGAADDLNELYFAYLTPYPPRGRAVSSVPMVMIKNLT